MATLSKTTPGQLFKYTSGILDNIDQSIKNSKSVKGGVNSFYIVDNDNNTSNILLYSSLSIDRDTEKEALKITLDTKDGKKVKFGAFDKPSSANSANKGDVAEGILSAAIVARFVNKNKNINENDINHVIDKLGQKVDQNKKTTLESPNKNPKIKDEVIYTLSMPKRSMGPFLDKKSRKVFKNIFLSAIQYANSTIVKSWSKMLYENNRINKIEVISDGQGDQTGTKVDIRVKVDNEPTDINISLKAGAVRQFASIGGTTNDKPLKAFKKLFNVDVTNDIPKFEKLVYESKIEDAFALIFKTGKRLIDQKLSNKTTKKNLLETLGKGIEFFATLNEKDVTLVQLDKKDAKIYDFSNLADRLSTQTLKTELILDKNNKPTLRLNNQMGKNLIQLRVRKETQSSGSLYFREVLEKGPALSELISISAK